MEPRIQYARTSDGVNIAYGEAGTGKPVFCLAPPGFTHTEIAWRMFANLLHPLAAEFRTVWADPRGTGLSDRDAIDFSIEAMNRDLEAVVDRTGADSFVLAAWTGAVPCAIAYAANHPDQVSHLVLCDGWASYSDWSHTPALQASLALLELDWTLFTETFGQVVWAYADGAFGRLFAELMKASTEPDAHRAIWKAWQGYDVSELMPNLTTPTLVVHSRNNRLFPVAIGRRMAAAIPSARLALIDDDASYASVPDLIRMFLDQTERASAAAPALPSGTAVILFADIADSTALTERLGDAAFRAKARDLDAALRTVIRDHSGTPIDGKLLGDGVLAVFTSARQAIEAALACAPRRRRRAASPSTSASTPATSSARTTTSTAAPSTSPRASAASSAPGEVLVSETVRSLARTSAGVRFEDRGEQALKGVGEPVRVWAVREGGVMEPRIQYAKTSDGVSIAYCDDRRAASRWSYTPGSITTSPAGVAASPAGRRGTSGWRHSTVIRYDRRGTGLVRSEASPTSRWRRMARTSTRSWSDVGLREIRPSGAMDGGPRLSPTPRAIRSGCHGWSSRYAYARRIGAHRRSKTTLALLERDWELFTEPGRGRSLRVAGQRAWSAPRRHVCRESVTQDDMLRFVRDVRDVGCHCASARKCSVRRWCSTAPRIGILTVGSARRAGRADAGSRLRALSPVARGLSAVLGDTAAMVRAIDEFLARRTRAPRRTRRQLRLRHDRDHPLRRHRRLHRPHRAPRRRRLPREGPRPRRRPPHRHPRPRRHAHRRQAPRRRRPRHLHLRPPGHRSRPRLRARPATTPASPSTSASTPATSSARTTTSTAAPSTSPRASAALSAPGEVLVSDTVRGLARTSAGVAFEDRGEQALKGVGEPVRVWAVRGGRSDGATGSILSSSADGVTHRIHWLWARVALCSCLLSWSYSNMELDWRDPGLRALARTPGCRPDARRIATCAASGLPDERSPTSRSEAQVQLTWSTSSTASTSIALICSVRTTAPAVARPTRARLTPARVQRLVLWSPRDVALIIRTPMRSTSLIQLDAYQLALRTEAWAELWFRVVRPDAGTMVRRSRSEQSVTPEAAATYWKSFVHSTSPALFRRYSANPRAASRATPSTSPQLLRQAAAAHPERSTGVALAGDVGHPPLAISAMSTRSQSSWTRAALDEPQVRSCLRHRDHPLRRHRRLHRPHRAPRRRRLPRESPRPRRRPAHRHPRPRRHPHRRQAPRRRRPRHLHQRARRRSKPRWPARASGDDAGLPLHLGLHAGDVIREDNNVYGGAVNIAARIAALSAPGEVLVSETVRGAGAHVRGRARSRTAASRR